MPEGPECRAIGGFVRDRLQGETITSIEVVGGRYLTHGVPEALETLREELPKTVTAVGVWGKLIFIILDDKKVILSTLGLSGKWTVRRGKHSGICIVHGKHKKRLWFDDQLHYGTLRVTDVPTLGRTLKSLGPDVTLGDRYLPMQMWEALTTRYRGWEIAKFLMDQKRLAGIGNYLKAEILYESRISPHKTLGSLSDEESKRLYNAIVTIPKAWYVSRTGGGPVMKFKVYGKKRCAKGHKVIVTNTLDGRTSYWSPAVQDPSFASAIWG